MTVQAPRKITFNSLVAGKLDVDDAGLAALTGWAGWVNKSEGVSQFAAADGGALQNLWVASRQIVLNVFCRANDSVTVLAAFARTQDASTLLVDWVANGVEEHEQADMRTVSVVDARTRLDEVAGIRRFLVTMESADPFVYSQTLNSVTGPVDGGELAWAMPHLLPGTATISTGAPATLSVNNLGLVTWPSFQVEGPTVGTMNGLSLILGDTGETLEVPDLAAGSTMLIDANPSSRLLTVDGFDRLAQAGGVFWSLPEGESTVRLSAGGNTAGATVTIFWRTARL